MKAAIYARFSTSQQDASSLEGHERVCRAFADARGIEVVAVYTDAVVSGTHLQREGLQRLLADARARKFRAVIVPDLSRLSRDRIDSGVLVRQLADLDVRVLDVETGTDSDDESADVIHAVKGIVNAEYVKAIRIHTHRQLQTRALSGFHTGGKAYGYTSVEEPNPADPKKPRRRTVADAKEAAVVVRVFTEFDEGRSPRQIAQGLNDDGVAAPHDGGRGFKSGRGWGFTTIRSMLQNRRYVGEVVWNASKWKKTSRGTRRRIARPDSERVVQHHPDLAIVEPALWERVQARFTQRAGSGKRQRVAAPKHVLAGLLRCGQCGGTFGTVHTRVVKGTKYRTLGCISAKDRGPAICTNNRTISDRKVVAALVKHLRAKLSRPDRVEPFVAAFEQRYAELQNADGAAELEAKVEKQRALVSNVEQALVTCPGSAALAGRLQAEEKQLAVLQAELESKRRARPTVVPHPAAIARYVEELATVMESGDVERAGSILRRALAPFSVHPEAAGVRLSGAINLSLSEKCSSGGVI